MRESLRSIFLPRLVVIFAVAGSAAWLWAERPAGVAAAWFIGVHVLALLLVLAVTDVVGERVAQRAPGGMATARTLTALAALVAAPILAARAMEAMEGATNRIWSDAMWEPAPELGPTEMKLKRNVHNAVAVVPDRPVLNDEMVGVDLDDRIRRRRTFHVNTNAAGLRGTAEVETPKTRFRMLCLGSSVTFGHGVEDDQSWCALLGAALGIEALNGGMPGRRPSGVVAWASRYGADLDPDLVVFSEVPVRTGSGTGAEDYVTAARALQALYPKAKLAIAIAPASPFTPRKQGNTWLDRAPSLSAGLPGVPVLDTTAALGRAAEARGGLTVVFDGTGQRLVDAASGKVYVEASSKIPSREICAAFEADPSLRVPFFIDMAHVDAEGHAVIAETLLPWLQENRLVP